MNDETLKNLIEKFNGHNISEEEKRTLFAELVSTTREFNVLLEEFLVALKQDKLTQE